MMLLRILMSCFVLSCGLSVAQAQDRVAGDAQPITSIVDVIEAEFDALVFEDSVFSDSRSQERFTQFPRYLSDKQVGELITVVKSDNGEIVVDILPALAQEFLRGDEVEGYYLLQELQKRLQARFEYEGL